LRKSREFLNGLSDEKAMRTEGHDCAPKRGCNCQYPVNGLEPDQAAKWWKIQMASTSVVSHLAR
jgi:hypothetical protein